LKKLRDGGVDTRIIHWTLDGEPFMNKRFAEVVEEAVALGFDTHHFATNAFLMTLDRLYEFPAEGQRYFLTPDFCSDAAYFEHYRGTPGSWRRVRENLLAALKDPGLSHFQFKVTDISSYTIRDEAELERRFEALKALFPESDRISFYRRTYHNAAGFSPIDETKRKGKYHLCPYPWYSFVIASNGDVVSCCRDLEHKTVLGNLFEQDFEEIWNGERYQALRRDLIEGRPESQAACAGCDMPHDNSKFSMANLAKTAVHRMLLFEKATG
jgi:radical SAM protein with 4Fe4S-binding SPASM domain